MPGGRERRTRALKPRDWKGGTNARLPPGPPGLLLLKTVSGRVSRESGQSGLSPARPCSPSRAALRWRLGEGLPPEPERVSGVRAMSDLRCWGGRSVTEQGEWADGRTARSTTRSLRFERIRSRWTPSGFGDAVPATGSSPQHGDSGPRSDGLSRIWAADQVMRRGGPRAEYYTGFDRRYC